jgi:hypothetical protein
MRQTCPAALAALAVAVGAFVVSPRPAAAQAGPNIRVTINPASISFPDRDPDMPPPYVNSIPTTIEVRIRVRDNAGGNWLLTLAANDHLRSGADVITVDNITWVTAPATPPWTSGGTMALAPGQTVASGQNDQDPEARADLEFRLANLWTYAAGVYSTTAVFTLSAP